MSPNTTPVQLEGMRKILGLSHSDCALLLGGPNQEEVRTLEKPQTRFVHTQHEAVLGEMLDRVDDLIDQALWRAPDPPFLVTYRDDVRFAEFDPELAGWMKFAVVHRMFVSRLWWAFRLNGVDTTIVALDYIDYMDFLKRGDRNDTRDARREWASEYVPRYYSVRDTPVTKRHGNAEQLIARRSSWRQDTDRPRSARERLKGETTVI